MTDEDVKRHMNTAMDFRKEGEAYVHAEYKNGENPLIVAIEELSELTKELTKALRGNPNRDRIIEETGDVQVVIPQIMEIFGFTLNDTFPVMLAKQKRTRGIMHAEGETDDQTD